MFFTLEKEKKKKKREEKERSRLFSWESKTSLFRHAVITPGAFAYVCVCQRWVKSAQRRATRYVARLGTSGPSAHVQVSTTSTKDEH